jgi:1,6-anhydro-N-acetylmuramate kinase
LLIDIWLLQHAAALAEQAASHLTAAANTIQHETHLLLEDITGLGHPGGHMTADGPPIDGGCAER